jgi:hypothetical protein
MAVYVRSGPFQNRVEPQREQKARLLPGDDSYQVSVSDEMNLRSVSSAAVALM